jgi:hypothetical protein
LNGTYKEYASRFLPEKIHYLLIGESPPFTPPQEDLRYFYNYKSRSGMQILLSNVSYSFLNRKFYSKRNNREEYLEDLIREGVFLLDATYEPINQIKDKKMRRSKIVDAYPQLKKNIDDLPMREDAKMFLIHRNVIEAIGGALREDFVNYKIYDIAFPRYHNDEEFKSRIRRAIEN